MRNIVFSLIVAAAASIGGAAFSQDQERLNEFVDLVEANGCRFELSYAGTAYLRENGFANGVEITALRRELVKAGLAELVDGSFVLKTDNCT